MYTEVLIIDTDSLVHRNFHGYPPRYSKNGVDNRVLHGILSQIYELGSILSGVQEVYLVFDPKDGSAYRKQYLESYKENRPPADPELKRQKKEAMLILGEYMGFPLICYPGYEADDAIGSIVEAKKEKKITIVTVDKDIMQLINSNVNLLKRERNKKSGFNEFVLIDESGVKDSFGVVASKIADYLALVGDVADNLPGLPGVGQKTAISLLEQFSDIEDLITRVDQVKNKKLQEKIINNQEQLRLMKKLTTIHKGLNMKEYLAWSTNKALKIREKSEYGATIAKIHYHYDFPDKILDLFQS